MKTAHDKLSGFRSFPLGWHFGEGDQISKDNIQTALKLVEFAELCGCGKHDAFPGVGGEVAVRLYNLDDTLEFIVECECGISYAFYGVDSELEHDDLSLKEALKIIKGYKKWARSLCGYSTRNILILQEESLSASHSETIADQSQQYFINAQSIDRFAFATT